ncbi:serum response factor homolog [Penaeus japonicus]|uniref:serum response factor homolog n=1 Tax=Penaeus japonicus TaxID=27405 RepID=UPI001C7115B2|nr:serum response factor homolog [Penaeus japonicus]
MQNPSHNNVDDKFGMNFGGFDPELFSGPHMGGPMGGMGIGMKRSAHDAGLDREPLGLSSDDDSDLLKKDDKMHPSSSNRDAVLAHQTNLESQNQPSKPSLLPNGKKTKGRVKIKMEFIDNKLRRYTTFSKRKTGIMKKAYELSTLTGTQVMLLVASETGHVYTFATRKLQPMITSEAGKALIQTCLNSPDPPQVSSHQHDQRMSATGYEETELTYAVNEDEHKVRQMMYSAPTLNSMHQGGTMASPSHHAAAAAAAAAAALQTHHHQPQYHHPHPPPTPHLSTPTSTHHMSHHHHHLSQASPGHTAHAAHGDHAGVGLHQHTHLVAPQTPLPSHSPLPPHSPMGAPSPTSPYPSVHHHPHHHIPTHSR